MNKIIKQLSISVSGLSIGQYFLMLPSIESSVISGGGRLSHASS